MYNADCTLYSKVGDGYVRSFIPDVYWQGTRNKTERQSGAMTTKTTNVYIYEKTDIKPQDLLVRGNCSFEFDNTSQQTVSQSMKEFGNNFVTVKTVQNYWFGNLPHFEVICD